MDPQTSYSSSSLQLQLPKAPPTYYDFPPSYTPTSSYNSNFDAITDELPIYCAREPRLENRRIRVYTLMSDLDYGIRGINISRTLYEPPSSRFILNRPTFHLLVGTFFLVMLVTLSLITVIVAFST